VAASEFWRTVVFRIERSSTWMVQVASINIGMVCAKNQKFYRREFRGRVYHGLGDIRVQWLK